MKDRNRILNDIVQSAADIMEAKISQEEVVSELMEEKGGEHSLKTAAILRERVEQTKRAVQLMRDNAGCWV